MRYLISAQITMHNVETTGTELVEVSSHWGAREGTGHANHAGWQGKIYSVHGNTPEYPNLEEVTGYPSDPRGLCGYNCRHTFYPYWEGISEPTDFPAEPAPVTVDGREYTYYQATQEQRRREREIRAMKREANALEAAGETDAAKELRAAIYGKTQEYKQFSQDVGIRAKGERLGVGEKANTSIFANEHSRLSKTYSNSVSEKGLTTPGFKEKFSTISEKKVVNKAVYTCACKSLEHRSGTNGEDLYLIDGNTGAVLLEYTDSTADKAIVYTPDLEKAVNEAHRRSNNIIALHNHPNGMPPSLDDGVSARYRGYSRGIVVGHNLEVFEYTPARKVYSGAKLDDVHKLINESVNFDIDFDETVWYNILEQFGMVVKRIET